MSPGSLHPGWSARVSGLNHSAVTFQFQEQSYFFFISCSSFMVMVVSIIIYSDVTGRGLKNQRWISYEWWPAVGMNVVEYQWDSPGPLFFLCTFTSLSPKIPKGLIELGLHQWSFPGGLVLMSVITASTDVQSRSNQVNMELWKQLMPTMVNFVVLWEQLVVLWTSNSL